MRDVLGLLIYFSIAVFNYAIAYLFLVVDRHTFGWADIDPMVLFLVHIGGAFFLPISAVIVAAMFRLEGFKGLFAACWLLVFMFFLFRDILSGFEHK